MKKITILTAAFVFSGCATPYQDMGFRGGVSALRLDETTVSITASGNAFTSPDAITQYVLRKASEETLADGYEIFSITHHQNRGRTVDIVVPASSTSYTQANATAFGDSAYGTATTNTYTQPAHVNHYFKPGEAVTIQMSKGPCPQYHVEDTFCAANLLKYMLPSRKG